MKIDTNSSLFVGQNVHGRHMEEVRGETQKQSNGVVFAGDLNNVTDTILQRKQEARQKAMKIISDAWEGDKQIDADIESRRERIRKLQDEMGRAQKELTAIVDEQNALRETYGVDTDSEEYKDLELLLKRKRATRSGSEIRLTVEERKQLAEIDKKEKTEYQRRVLEWEDYGDYYHSILENSKREILAENAVIRGIRQERLKKAPMVGAQKQADATLAAASEEILDMLTEESLDHMKEEQKEQEEQAEKVQAKEEEWEELLQLEHIQMDIQKEIQDVMNKMKLVEEDVKGAVVDGLL